MNDTQMMNRIQNIILYQTKVKKIFVFFKKNCPQLEWLQEQRSLAASKTSH